MLVIAVTLTVLVAAAFIVIVIGIHATDRRLALRQPDHGCIDIFTRRLLGVAHRENELPEHDYIRR